MEEYYKLNYELHCDKSHVEVHKKVIKLLDEIESLLRKDGFTKLGEEFGSNNVDLEKGIIDHKRTTQKFNNKVIKEEEKYSDKINACFVDMGITDPEAKEKIISTIREVHKKYDKAKLEDEKAKKKNTKKNNFKQCGYDDTLKLNEEFRKENQSTENIKKFLHDVYLGNENGKNFADLVKESFEENPIIKDNKWVFDLNKLNPKLVDRYLKEWYTALSMLY